MIGLHLIPVTSISPRKAEAIVHPKGSHALQHNFARLGGYKRDDRSLASDGKDARRSI